MKPVQRAGMDDLRFFCEISATKLQDDFLPRLRTALSFVPEDRIWERNGETLNSIGMTLTHMEGNLRQWSISAFGHEADRRNRNREFLSEGAGTGKELLDMLTATVRQACSAIRSASGESLRTERTIQGYDVTGIEAVYHAVEHFSYHLGQIIQEAKRISGQDLKLYPF